MPRHPFDPVKKAAVLTLLRAGKITKAEAARLFGASFVAVHS